MPTTKENCLYLIESSQKIDITQAAIQMQPTPQTFTSYSQVQLFILPSLGVAEELSVGVIVKHIEDRYGALDFEGWAKKGF